MTYRSNEWAMGGSGEAGLTWKWKCFERTLLKMRVLRRAVKTAANAALELDEIAFTVCG